MNYAQIFIAALLLFASGGATGYFMGLKIHKTQVVSESEAKLDNKSRSPWMHGDPLRHFVSFLERELQISDDQKSQINTIVDESNERMKVFWKGVQPKAREEMESTREKIKAVLTSDQAAKYDELMEEFRQKRFRRGPGRREKGDRENGDRGPRRPGGQFERGNQEGRDKDDENRRHWKDHGPRGPRPDREGGPNQQRPGNPSNPA